MVKECPTGFYNSDSAHDPNCEKKIFLPVKLYCTNLSIITKKWNPNVSCLGESSRLNLNQINLNFFFSPKNDYDYILTERKFSNLIIHHQNNIKKQLSSIFLITMHTVLNYLFNQQE